MDTPKKIRQTTHIRLKPAPAVLITTVPGVHDRLELGDGMGPSAGVYRRVSEALIASLTQERDKEPLNSERWKRIDSIVKLAKSAPHIVPGDFENPPIPDLSHY